MTSVADKLLRFVYFDLSSFSCSHPCRRNQTPFHGEGGKADVGINARALASYAGRGREFAVFRAIKITANRNYRRINRVITAPLMLRIGARAPAMVNIVTAVVIGTPWGESDSPL